VSANSTSPKCALALALLVVATAAAYVPADRARGAPPDLTPLEVFRRHYGDRDPKIRRKAVRQLRDVSGPEVTRALVRALADPDERVARAARELLERAALTAADLEVLTEARQRERDPGVRRSIVTIQGAAGGDAVTPLVDALGDRDGGVREAAVRALTVAGARPLSEEALRALHGALRDRVDRVRAAAVDGLGALRGGDATGAACAVLRGDRADAPRVAAALVLGTHPRPEAVEHLVLGVRDRSWALRVACSRALGAQREDTPAARAAAAALVPALAAETRMRVAEELAEALFRLTGIDFGPDSARWNAWFREAGTSFEPPPRPPRRTQPGPGSTRAGLLDLPTESDHVTFVLDGSHSMSDGVRLGAVNYQSSVGLSLRWGSGVLA
jgi:HEAT repeat protein